LAREEVVVEADIRGDRLRGRCHGVAERRIAM
jgi:hypothetical protein